MKLHCTSRSGGLQSAVGLRRLGSRRSLISAFLFLPTACTFAAPVVVGSKKFTESYVLGEIAKRTLTDAGIPAEHRQGMGGTIILWEALRGGQIDAYPEYTGTIATEILKSDSQRIARSNSECRSKKLAWA